MIGSALTRAETTPRYISLKDAVLRFGTSKSTLYLMIQRGHIRAVKRGGRTLIDVESADKYFDSLPELK
jgi:excisionase family DNA binding protein